ncbi:MAG: GlsB/YeaQ/YmgE family stress response membrane protein [Actinobacteria bacterium]|nr:GlsB/YeaQ/YmgE family stress response membrane protein [Actinomycetota bacterium]NIS36848.1 GlsB/YeaQ/YmgE family stress response membrane protein [Actinomycetota bacterium]NIT98945.1 GlsB/YeaQ/YmgE family stress response membrane protein [Actinomycetota bacterium]NIU22593.1 GlsB/YeaQ/YmgE family stress response membrane protein [Actinomycetota bacterium]NIU71338.1 GlsB/YeaQ/YmgE family stress response membrane protein [Actinomycetota bacterium]
MEILAWIVPGLVAGLIARMVVPTGRRYGCLGTILLGIAGSFVGGALASLVSDDGLALDRASWIGSILGAIVILVVVRFLDSRR